MILLHKALRRVRLPDTHKWTQQSPEVNLILNTLRVGCMAAIGWERNKRIPAAVTTQASSRLLAFLTDLLCKLTVFNQQNPHRPTQCCHSLHLSPVSGPQFNKAATGWVSAQLAF